MTRADIEVLRVRGWEGDGPNPDLGVYLDCKVCRVRLPDVRDVGHDGDEDRIGQREMDKRPEYRIPLDADTIGMLDDVDHADLWFPRSGVNFRVSCPLGKNRASVKSSPVHNFIYLSAEGLGKDTRRDVYRCPYCSAQFNLNGHPLQPHVLARFYDEWHKMGNEARQFDYLYDLIRCGSPALAASV